MNNKKSRSSLKKGPTQADEEPDPVRTIKRRISFSGKKFIREFDTTEKPRDYDNSYEISDHTNGDDSSGQTHGTVAASVLQSTAHISLANEMDKENTSPIAIALGSVYEQNSRFSDSTLKLQTSINVTLLPDEMAKRHRRMESPAPLESMSSDSLSLYEAERVKLRENSVYRMPVFEKTMDLVPEKLAFAEEPKDLENRDEQKTIVIPTDISCVTQQVCQKTVLFENKDISCDFTDIEPKESCWAAGATAKPTQENESIDVVEKDYMNYLPDDSTLSSPLIPLDVISENGISKKLNFRQLNDALNSGQIQLFPNGPKTPTTDRKAKQQRFWHGLEQQPAEQDVPLREVIKPRGTLNFNESMMMSPTPQRPEPNLMATADHFEQPVKAKSSHNPRRNYRFSQADELMLDNTNFLVHARIGDETQSRNSSKSSSRRETTYDNTAMELDDLEKCEAAMRAALEIAKHKETMQRLEPMEEETLLSPCKNAINVMHMSTAVQQCNQADLNPHKAQPSQQRSKLRQSLHMSEPIEETSFDSHNELKSGPPATPTASQRMRHRQTLHMAEPIVEDIVIPHIEPAAPQMKNNTRRQTIHSAEAMDEDIVVPRQELPLNSLAPAVEKHYGRRRQTLHMVDSIEEDSFCSNKGGKTIAASIKSKHNKYRQTLLMAEPIQEDVMGPQKEPMPQPVQQQISGRRQSLNLNESIGEDSFYSATAAPVELHDNKNRHTMHMAEFIEEDFVRPQQNLHAQPTAPTMEEQYIRRRQTLHLVESIEEIVVQPQSKFTAVEQQHSRHRQTLHLADPIEEDSFCSMSNAANQHRDKFPGDKPIKDELKRQSEAAAVGLQSNRRRQTLHMADPIEEDSICSMSAAINSHRHTLQRDAPIAEDGSNRQEELRRQSETSAVGLHSNRRRQTLHMADPIEEDSICSMSAAANSHRHTLQRDTPIAEDGPKPQEQLRRQPEAPSVGLQSNRRRQTLHMADPIEEDSICSMSAAANSHRHTLQRYAEDVLKPREELKPQSTAPTVALQYNRRRQTLHTADPIQEDSFCSKPTPVPVEAHASKNGRDLLTTEAIDIDEIKSHAQLQSTSAAHPAEKPSNKHRQTLLMSESIQEDITSAQKVTNSKSMARQTLNIAEPIEEAICNAAKSLKLQADASIDQYNKNARQTYFMEEAMEEDISCNQSKPTTPPKFQLQRKPRHTLHRDEAMDVEMPKVAPTEQRSSKSRPTLLMSDSLELELLSQSASEDIDKARGDSPSDSAEWLAQRLKAREALTKSMPMPKQEFPSPDRIEKGQQCQAVDTKSVFNRLINRTSVETPEMNKKQQNWYQNCFPITPGRSIIEYEDLEEECKVESPAAKPAVQSIYNTMDMELDMDTSNFGTPKQTTSFTVKRLPIHLTPNLPQPKKRNTHLPVKMEDKNVSAIELEASAQNVEQLTPARNRSRIPVLSKSLNSPWRETEQLDGTVQMVRAIMMGQTRCQKMEITHLTEDKAKTDPAMYEDNPITISDVSNHFTAQRELAKRSHAKKAEHQAKESSIESRSSNEHCNKSYATTHKRFINLSGDTVILAAAEVLGEESDVYEIDKTRLSLVSTLLDEEDDREKETANSSNIELESNSEPEACLEQLNPPAVAGAADACKKCKRCRRSMDNATTRNISADSFELPDCPDLDAQFERLERLRQRPRLEDVHKYWELKKLELNPDDEDEEKTHSHISDTCCLSLAQMLEMFNNKCEEYKQFCPKPKPVERFVKCLEDSMRAQLPNWIFHDNLKYYRKYIFSHRKITTFQIVIDYEPLDLLESKIRVSSIQMRKSNIPPKFPLWNVYDHLMDFQLKLNLPLNLDRLLDGNEVEDFVKFLLHIDEVCLRVYSICKNMQMVLTTAGARLLRESNRIILRKTVRRLIKKEDEAFARMEKTNFKIEIGNVQEISFKDILQPTLYQFDEKIQFLPKGIAFLEAFLQNPDQFLRRNAENNN
ncbi:uncharacterized protein Spc105R isoform X2 [Drosophila montana]|uniref:uncharacterized protein Spc105R isoform X2 n=1 Tax=Drosophila montana TaxID=40370 RepID=UPI00313E2A04